MHTLLKSVKVILFVNMSFCFSSMSHVHYYNRSNNVGQVWGSNGHFTLDMLVAVDGVESVEEVEGPWGRSDVLRHILIDVVKM